MVDNTQVLKPPFKLKTPFDNPKLIVIEGAIGAGKTSLTRMLGDRWNAKCVYEVFEENPFLTRGFYEDTQRHGFNTEVFFLLSRYRQQKDLNELNEKSNLTLADYFFDKNIIFADMNLKGRDSEVYKDIYQKLEAEAQIPDLVVFLQADLETLLRRIYFRDRQFERALTPAYLEKLTNAYYRYFTSYTKAPVLTINTNRLDFVTDPKDFEKVCIKIEERLAGQIQLKLKTPEQMLETHAHA